MIDWITAVLPCVHDPKKLMGGLVASLDAQGTLLWTIDKPLAVEGSHSSTIQVKSFTDRTIWVSGNPAKWLQGHNIFGTDDLIYLIIKFFHKLQRVEDLGLAPSTEDLRRIADGDYFLTRVDVNQSWLLSNRTAVLTWIRAAGATCRLKRRGVGQYSGDTLYFAKNSRRWAVKCYSKGHELNAKGHKLHKDLQQPQLLEYADKCLRIELVLRSMMLKETSLNYAKNWTSDTSKQLLCSLVLDDLEISDNMPMHDDILDVLPVRLRLVYQSWKAGDDLRKILSKSAFYRWRKALLAYGIDIAIQQQSERNNVIPLIRYLEALPADIPDWAYKCNLVA